MDNSDNSYNGYTLQLDIIIQLLSLLSQGTVIVINSYSLDKYIATIYGLIYGVCIYQYIYICDIYDQEITMPVIWYHKFPYPDVVII